MSLYKLHMHCISYHRDLYWLPKIRINPTGSRFIVHALPSRCPNCLLFASKQVITNYFKGILRVNCFGIIDNSMQVGSTRLERLDSFDFSTLLTNIYTPWSTFTNTGLLVSGAYRIRRTTYLTTIDKGDTYYWTNTPSAKVYNIKGDDFVRAN